MKSTLIVLAVSATSLSASAATQQCKQQTIEKSVIEICIVPGEAFQHDAYTLKADNIPVFTLVDDYVEKVELEHTIPEGMTIEMPLSKQGEKVARITGGCVPESKDGMEVARLCNFTWGRYQIVKDVRFELD